MHGKKADAYKALEEYRIELEGGLPIEPTSITVAEYADRFHERREGTLKSPLSYKREELDIRHVKELFPKIELQDLTAAHIKEVYAKARKVKTPSEDGLWSTTLGTLPKTSRHLRKTARPTHAARATLVSNCTS